MAKQLLNEFADISALKKQQQQVVGVLDDVTKKLKEMQAMGLSFSKGSASTSGMKDAAKTIDEQAKAVARLEAEQKKLAAAQNELYKSEQQMVQVRKEAERQAKLEAQATNEQIGAYKRLEAEAALATQRFRDLAAQYGIESNEAKNAGIQAAALNQKLKDVDATVNLHQKNVGNYKEATVSLRTEIRTLTQTLAQMAMSGKENTKEYNDMVAKLGNLRDTMGDVSGRAKFFADDARWITAAASAVQGLVGAYAAYQGVVNLVGEENKELQKSMMKIQSLMAIIMGMQQVAKTLNKDEAAMTAFRVIKQQALALQLKVVAAAEASKTVAVEAGTIAAKAQAIAWNGLSKAMKAAPFIAIAAAVTALAVAWINSRNESMKYANAQKVMADMTAMAAESIADEKTELELAVAVAKDSNRSLDERQKAIKRINDISPEYLGNITLENINTKEATEAIKGYVKVLTDKARAEALLKVMSEENARIMKATAAIMGGLEGAGFMDWAAAQVGGFTSGLGAYNAFLSQQTATIDSAKKNIENLKKAAEQMDFGAMFSSKDGAGKSVIKSVVDQTKKDVQELGDVVKIAFTDLFPDDFDAKWEAWQKKLDETPEKIDEVVESINELGVSISFVDKAIAEMAKKNEFEDWVGHNMESLEKWADMASKVANSISSIMSDTYKKQSDEAEAAHTKEMDSLKKMLNQGIIDQASYDAQSAALEEKYIAEKKERDRKEFERKKAIAIAEGTVNMALALIKIWSSDGSIIEKLALSVVEAAALAAQISSMRVASYATGREDGPAELAYVGERGFEYVETSSGKLYKTPNTATLTYLNAGDKVYTHTQSVDLEKTLGVNSLSTISFGKSDENSLLYGKMDEMIRVYKNKKEVHMNLSRSGVMMAIKDGNRWSRHLNDNVRL
jgi:hypothetical protein